LQTVGIETLFEYTKRVTESIKIWQAFDVTVTGEAREAVEYGLMEAGAVGTETSTEPTEPIVVRGYFNRQVNSEVVHNALSEALRIYGVPSASLIDLTATEVPDRDWLAEWKKGWKPVEVGRFIIEPPWMAETAATVEAKSLAAPGDSRESLPEAFQVASEPIQSRILVRINPGLAFGTGTHETTRLCLKAIDKYFRGGSLLDIGTGTGILAIAATKMFARATVAAYDIDADAIAIAIENARFNGVADRIDFRVGSVNEETSSADLVCANLTARTIVELLPTFLGLTCGRLILSGILDSQIALIEAHLLQLGAPVVEIETDGEWVSIIA
jgi:ribosomal protein L11 methyltransferase